MKELFQKYRELILYLVFGVLTTAVNYVAYLICAPFFERTIAPTLIAWVLSVLFAYFTNRRWVFQSKAQGRRAVLTEMGSFFGARVLSGVLDVAIMWVFVDKLGFWDKLIKLLSNVFVVIFNYVASKLWIFRSKENAGKNS